MLTTGETCVRKTVIKTVRLPGSNHPFSRLTPDTVTLRPCKVLAGFQPFGPTPLAQHFAQKAQTVTRTDHLLDLFWELCHHRGPLTLTCTWHTGGGSCWKTMLTMPKSHHVAILSAQMHEHLLLQQSRLQCLSLMSVSLSYSDDAAGWGWNVQLCNRLHKADWPILTAAFRYTLSKSPLFLDTPGLTYPMWKWALFWSGWREQNQNHGLFPLQCFWLQILVILFCSVEESLSGWAEQEN